MIRLGGNGIPGGDGDPVAFARAHRAYGYGAAYCPPVTIKDTQRLAAIEKAFAAENVAIAEVGIWRNLVTRDAAVRKAHREIAAEKLVIADAVGAKCAVSFIGSYEPGSDYGPNAHNLSDEAFDDAVEAARYLIDTVKPKRAKFALEMEQYSLPDSVDMYVKLIKAVDRPEFGCHVDPVNLVMTPRTYFNTPTLLREIFDKLGPWIVSCHAKDIILYHQAALHFDEIIIGKGTMDYRVFLACLEKLGREVPLMMEHLTDAEYAIARDEIFKVGDAAGIGFVNRRVGAMAG
ncbi:MAG: sugar phosphate isomerase/epimerase [Bauldia sp.]